MSRIQKQIISAQPGRDLQYAGIDVSKNQLDAYIHPQGVALAVPNDASGFEKISKWFSAKGVIHIVMEATGKYHRKAHESLHAQGFAVTVLNPYRSRRFAQALGELAKTDKIDATVLARFASMVQPKSTPPSPKALQDLKELAAARRQVTADMTALKNQITQAEHDLVLDQMNQRLTLLQNHQTVLDQEIYRQIMADAFLANQFQILTSIPSVGTVCATTIIADLGEIGTINASEIATLAGVAPMYRDSGTWRGTRSIYGGRHTVRKSLYMTALLATQGKGPFASFYKRLIGLGKKPKVALTAVMRKLIILANTLIKENRSWSTIAP